MRRKIVALLVPLLGLLTIDAALAAKKPANAPLLKLFDTAWQEDLADDPIAATGLGDARYNDKLTDMSPEAIAKRNQRAFTYLAALRKIDRAKLEKPDQLNYDLFERDVKGRLSEAGYKPYAYAVRTFDGPQLLPQLTEVLPFKTVKDYDDWIARLNGTGVFIDQWIALLTQCALEGRTQPRVTIAKVLDQIKAQLVTDPEASPFYAPFKKIPDSIDAATKARLTAAGKTAVQTVAIPAFQRFETFFRDVYLPKSRDTVGAYDTPDGIEFYRNRIRYYTTVDNMTPTQIHNLGLEEVKRIRAEMEKALEPINFLGTLDQFLNELRVNPRFYYKTSEELMAAYEKTARGIEPQLPKLFGRLPKTGFDIRPIPAASAPTTTTAYYQPPSLDGTRKGTFYVNLYKPETRPTWEVDALTAHEAVPGHHLQVALAYELQGLPEFRRNADYTAFIEGWALYSEGLGAELGLYKDEFSKFGQLNYDMWRAVRLVVDTGMHSFKWTREQAIYYFRQNTGKNLQDIENEVDRYISWPGQALAYKLGQLKIQALRAEAEKALGARFDIRAFHDQLLGMGPLPLSVLEVEMREWIAAQSAKR
jgi:prolyl oligopeptidase